MLAQPESREMAINSSPVIRNSSRTGLEVDQAALEPRVQVGLPRSISMTRVELKAVIHCKRRRVSRKEEAGCKASSRN